MRSNSCMYAACNHAGDVCLVDGQAGMAVQVWPRQQLEPADNPAGSGSVDLDWSPNGEKLIVSRRGSITFIHFGPEECAFQMLPPLAAFSMVLLQLSTLPSGFFITTLFMEGKSCHECCQARDL